MVAYGRIAVIGGGKMGEAILAGWISSNKKPADAIDAKAIVVAEPGEERRGFLEREHGVECVAGVSSLLRADIVLLSVKPQVMKGVLAEISSNPALSGGEGALPLFVSIAAGVTTATLESGLPAGAHVVRVMPNMPLLIGAGASGVCGGSTASSDEVDFVAGLFGCLGVAVKVDEADMDAVCALSGSGPAYVAAMIEAMRDAAAKQGLDEGLAESLALQTVLGTARLIAETAADIAKTRESICSPGGTTIAALDAMNEAGFAGVFDAGIAAAVQRSKELAQCS